MKPVSCYYVVGNWLVKLNANRTYLGLTALQKKLSPEQALLSASASPIVLFGVG